MLMNDARRQRPRVGGFKETADSLDSFDRVGSLDRKFVEGLSKSAFETEQVERCGQRKLQAKQTPWGGGERCGHGQQPALQAESVVILVETYRAAPFRRPLGQPDGVVARAESFVGKGVIVGYIDDPALAYGLHLRLGKGGRPLQSSMTVEVMPVEVVLRES